MNFCLWKGRKGCYHVLKSLYSHFLLADLPQGEKRKRELEDEGEDDPDEEEDEEDD